MPMKNVLAGRAGSPAIPFAMPLVRIFMKAAQIF